MNEEEQEAIEKTKKKIESTQKGLKEGKYYGEQFNLEREIKREQTLLNYIDKLQEELKKRDKVINLMAFEITENTGSCPLDIYNWKNKKYDNCIDCNDTCKECFIEYFYKQMEENDE